MYQKNTTLLFKAAVISSLLLIFQTPSFGTTHLPHAIKQGAIAISTLQKSHLQDHLFRATAVEVKVVEIANRLTYADM